MQEVKIISLCIPRVSQNISHKDIYSTFLKLNIGLLKRVDIIERQNQDGEIYKRAFIHFKEWYNNDKSLFIMERLKEGKDIKIVYDEPWYWKVSENKSVRGNSNVNIVN